MNVRIKNTNTPATRVAGVFPFVVISFFVVFILSGCGSQMADKPVLEGLSELSINTSSGKHSFMVELALDDSSQAKGLMFRRSMAADHGMLFIYDPEQLISMWMKNTVLSLDMLFVKRDGTIVKIYTRTEPFSERVLSSKQPVYGVLELNAGIVETLGVKLGDRITHPLLSGH